MKGIILAGGAGTRLYPITQAISKQLMPIYDKPMIYYPLATLMEAGVREILIITTPQDMNQFQRLLGDGSQFGIELTYCIQLKPDGIAKAFILGRDFIANDNVCLILGDNIFYGTGLGIKLRDAAYNANQDKATVFAYQVKDPQRYGVAEIHNGKVVSIEEKPKVPKSNFAVTGLYVYPNNVVRKVTDLKPSARGELEITDLNNVYLKESKLYCNVLPKGFAWLDTGTNDSLMKASSFIESIETRQGIQVACLEEIAHKQQWITDEELKELAEKHKASEYGQYLQTLVR